MHDAHVAALCLEHGVTELLTSDRDLRRFQMLVVRDPFAAPTSARERRRPYVTRQRHP